jgi:PKD repeat protein
MKKIGLFFMLVSIVAFTSSCKKEVEDALDCLFESAYKSVSHTVDEQNPKKVTFTVSYTGDYTLDTNISWNFGDGNSITSNGTTITHTYAAAGTYEVVTKITVRHEGSHCTTDHKKSITVN